jgi:hypothetical protein
MINLVESGKYFQTWVRYDRVIKPKWSEVIELPRDGLGCWLSLQVPPGAIPGDCLEFDVVLNELYHPIGGPLIHPGFNGPLEIAFELWHSARIVFTNGSEEFERSVQVWLARYVALTAR